MARPDGDGRPDIAGRARDLARSQLKIGAAHIFLDSYEGECRKADDEPAGCGTLALGCGTIVAAVVALWALVQVVSCATA